MVKNYLYIYIHKKVVKIYKRNKKYVYKIKHIYTCISIPPKHPHTHIKYTHTYTHIFVHTTPTYTHTQTPHIKTLTFIYYIMVSHFDI